MLYSWFILLYDSILHCFSLMFLIWTLYSLFIRSCLMVIVWSIITLFTYIQIIYWSIVFCCYRSLDHNWSSHHCLLFLFKANQLIIFYSTITNCLLKWQLILRISIHLLMVQQMLLIKPQTRLHLTRSWITLIQIVRFICSHTTQLLLVLLRTFSKEATILIGGVIWLCHSLSGTSWGLLMALTTSQI